MTRQEAIILLSDLIYDWYILPEHERKALTEDILSELEAHEIILPDAWINSLPLDLGDEDE